MYAIESKKRKFDRVLESISNPSSHDLLSQTSLPGQKGQTGTALSTKTLTSSDSKKRLRVSDEFAEQKLSKKPSAASLQQQQQQQQPNYLPHSQPAFLSRLSTYSPIQNWRIGSSEKINAVQWARRGWSCVGRDRVACRGGCEAEMLVKLEDDQQKVEEETQNIESDGGENDEERQEAAEIEAENHRKLVDKYAELIVSAHLEHCHWRRKGCDASIQRLPLLNTQISIHDLQMRYDELLKKSSKLPTNIRLISDNEGPEPDFLNKLTSDSQLFNNSSNISWSEQSRSAFLLALAGWESSGTLTDVDVVECRSCFRRLGLWLYCQKGPGETPTMEHLDAVESHLDFCPWKSSEAQHTELEIEGQKQNLSGWQLLSRNVEREMSKISREKAQAASDSRVHSVVPTGIDIGDEIAHSSSPQCTAEEKEKRSRALIRKIRELKKPFNVRALLKKDQKVDK
ncbi:putative c3hc zinc finger protein [Phaeomoniella chlamydospora]|uniref:Putative c3hc zinc finger protein n=1 Tax=Phaeomoniella chlamydospora TaxID=158046 RepID=A0A0G2EDA3_PHACM|nr:putative c3hc zinc finger protein [Phaeomoniella chlamydospora]